MSKIFPPLDEKMTYSLTTDPDIHVIHQLGYYHERARFCTHLNTIHAWIIAIRVPYLGSSSTNVCHGHIWKTDLWKL